MRRIATLAMFLIFLACAPIAALAQFETASVLGYVRDASGAVIPNATVTLTNQETKAQVVSKTNEQGAYQFTDVKIGQYQVAAQATGFDSATTQNFTVAVNARQRVDLAMKAGSNTETVTVDANAASLLETDNSERGQVIGTREVENLPLNGRAYADLAALVPGVRRNILENSTDSSRDASFNVNGQRSEFNNFLLDGLDNNAYGTSNQGFSNQAIPPSPDAISEFKVETDNYSAEYGRSSGAVVNVSIRSGTNKFHGKAYEYIRNTSLNAIGPFTPPTNALTGKPQKPVLQRNQFGGTFGGPILRDKLFIFGDYEGNRQIARALTTATIPTANQAGTSALAIANGGYTFLDNGTSTEPTTGAVKLINPLTGTVYSNGVIPFSDRQFQPSRRASSRLFLQQTLRAIHTRTTTLRCRSTVCMTTRATFEWTTQRTRRPRPSSATASIRGSSRHLPLFREPLVATATATSTSSINSMLAALRTSLLRTRFWMRVLHTRIPTAARAHTVLRCPVLRLASLAYRLTPALFAA